MGMNYFTVTTAVNVLPMPLWYSFRRSEGVKIVYPWGRKYMNSVHPREARIR